VLFGPDRPQQHPQEPPDLSTLCLVWRDRGFWDRTANPRKERKKIFFSVNLSQGFTTDFNAGYRDGHDTQQSLHDVMLLSLVHHPFP